MIAAQLKACLQGTPAEVRDEARAIA